MEKCLDDSDIPSRLIIQHTLGITISKTEGSTNMSELNVSAVKLGDLGGLLAATDEENFWVKSRVMSPPQLQTMGRDCFGVLDMKFI